jgi:hypothetical protein
MSRRKSRARESWGTCGGKEAERLLTAPAWYGDNAPRKTTPCQTIPPFKSFGEIAKAWNTRARERAKKNATC